MSTAAKVALDKQKHPERYCKVPGCLWRIKTFKGENPCKKHPNS